MATYRESRNIEASLIDYITDALTAGGWTNIRVVKARSQVYKGTLPCICVEVIDNLRRRKEIGSYRHIKDTVIEIRIFAKNDGQRLDLADYLNGELEKEMTYYEYITALSGREYIVDSKTDAGHIHIVRYIDDRKELTNTENLEEEDRYRHLIRFEINVSLSS